MTEILSKQTIDKWKKSSKMKYALKPRNKNKTVQEVGTDPKFLVKVRENFDLSWDLACNEKNCIIGGTCGYLYPETNALKRDWNNLDGFLWCNPPYKDIGPWVRKAYEESILGANILMLVPASVGSQWYKKYVHGKACVRFLTGRLTFIGHKAPYPKDLMLLIYAPEHFEPSTDLWDWKKEPLV